MSDSIESLEDSSFSTSDIFIAGTSIFLVGMIFIATGSLVTGITTGLISTLGLGFVLIKMRSNPVGGRVWNLMFRYPVMTDIVISLLFIGIMGTSTATGIISGATAAVLSSAMITFAAKFVGPVNNKISFSLKTRIDDL